MSDTSPFAEFYNNVFSGASPEEQHAYLQELFTKNGALCSSFYNFISHEQYSPAAMENHRIGIERKTRALQQEIKNYKWSVLWDVPVIPENYDEDLIVILEEKLVGSDQFPIQSMCSTGNLLEAIASMRIIELGLNIDWEKVEEPAHYYGREVGYFLSYQFDDYHCYISDAVFSVAHIKAALELIGTFTLEPGAFFNNTEGWEGLADLLREEAAGRVI